MPSALRLRIYVRTCFGKFGKFSSQFEKADTIEISQNHQFVEISTRRKKSNNHFLSMKDSSD